MLYVWAESERMINRVTLVGRLGTDPEIRTLANGVMVAKFSLATNESYRDSKGELREDVQWHDVVLWRGLAEQAQRRLVKGSLVFLEGKLTHRKYEDRHGNSRKVSEVVGQSLRLLDDRRKEAGASAGAISGRRRVGGEDLPF